MNDINNRLARALRDFDLVGVSLYRIPRDGEADELGTAGTFPKEQISSAARRQYVKSVPRKSLKEAARNNGIAVVSLAQTPNAEVVVLCSSNRTIFKLRSVDERAFDELKEAIWHYELQILQDRNKDLTEESSLVSASTTALLSSFDADGNRPPFEVTLEYLLKLFSLDHGTIWELHDNQWLTLEALSNTEIGRYKRNCLKRNEGLVWRALQPDAKKIQRLNGIQETDLKNVELYDSYRDRDIYLIRLGSPDHPYGVACLAGRDANSPPYKESILNTFEQFLAVELQSRRKDYTNRLFKSIQGLFTHDEPDIAGICRVISAQILKIIDCQAVTIVLKNELDPSSNEMEVVASYLAEGHEPSKEYIQFLGGSTIGYHVDEHSLTGSVATLGIPHLNNEVSSDSRNSFGYREVADRTNDTWIGIPILTASKTCIGVLRCSGKLTSIDGHRLDYVFDSLDQQLLTNAASILAPLLQHKHTSDVLRAMNERLEDAERIKEHEMRGPLQLIASQAAFVMKRLDDASATSKQRRLETVLTNVELCATLLTSAKLPSPETFRSELQEVQIRKVLLALVEVLKYQIESRSPSQITEDATTGELVMIAQPFMLVELNGTAPPIIGHRNLLQRAFYNIANNAVKYARWSETGRLTISIDQDAENLLVQFKDKGVGVPVEDREKIFGGHYRGVEARKRPGQGLGLKIAKAVVEQHGGHLSLTRLSNPTIFQVSLPLPPKQK